MKITKPFLGIIFYYFMESFAIALIITLFWKTSLQYRFNLELSLFDWTGIVLGLKLIRFDIVKVIGVFGINLREEKEENNEIH